MVMGVALTWGGTASAGASTHVVPPQCPVDYGVLITSHTGYFIPASGQSFKDGPGGTMTVSVTKASTITYTVSTSLEVGAEYLFASAKAQVSGSIQKSTAVTVGHTYAHDIGAKKYGHMQYGSSGYKVGWESNKTNPNCTTTTLAKGTATLPVSSVGWKYWETAS
ncbi:hypothetical protein [Streptomyces sp. NPDC058382]|uniref:hypothetical protein n=1 Tax=unclassified Streptomyces TaxID=2593676 RepID=UPI0036263E28